MNQSSHMICVRENGLNHYDRVPQSEFFHLCADEDVYVLF